MWSVVIAVLISPTANEICENRERREVMWYFDEVFQSCFVYPINCSTTLEINAELYSTDEECTLKHMTRMWKTYTISCPLTFELATFHRSNGDSVPYIFSPALCRTSHRQTVSDVCTAFETCYTNPQFAFCCNNRAFFGEGPAGGKFNFTGIGGPLQHIAGAATTSPRSDTPIDCNTEGDRRSIEWYPHSNMMCVARRADCEHPWFPVDVVNTTYSTQQLCMDSHFANWKMTYSLSCSDGFAPVVVDEVGLVFSKTLCGSIHHSDICNRDEYCAFNDQSPFAFCCRRSENNSQIIYSVYGNQYRLQRHKRHVKLVTLM